MGTAKQSNINIGDDDDVGRPATAAADEVGRLAATDDDDGNEEEIG